ncbi:MAG: hypothetical protein COZ08_04220, partial [Bacteroidetes bacterium CG_4_10_14_3_um_filter_42_6]
MKAKSIKGKSTEEIKTALLKSLVNARLPDGQGFKPTLAFVFISSDQDRKTISSMLDKEGIAIFGVTTVGEFTEEGVDSGSIVILLLDMNPDFFKLAIKDYPDGSAIDSGRYVGNIGKAAFGQPAFIISGSNMEAPGELIMQGILDEVNENSTVIGGMAGDCVFTNNH